MKIAARESEFRAALGRGYSPAMESWLAQYCINVSDLDRTVSFYEALGLECTSRTDIQVAKEAILENPNKGGKIQLAQQLANDGRDRHGQRLLEAVREHQRHRPSVQGRARLRVRVGDRARTLRPLAGHRRVRERSRRLSGRVRAAPPVARRRRHDPGLARPVLHQRARHRRCDQVLGDARFGVHEPDRHPGREGSDPREHGQGREDPTRAADEAGRAHRHGHRDVEAVRLHRRLRRASTSRRSTPATRQ